MPMSESQKRAKKKYEKKIYGYFAVKLKKPYIDLINKFCEIKGYTKNGFFTNAIFNQMEKDTGKTIEELKKDFEKIDNPTSIDDLDILEEYTFKDKE